MFKFLKEKLKGAISKFSKKAEEGDKAEAPIVDEKHENTNTEAKVIEEKEGPNEVKTGTPQIKPEEEIKKEAIETPKEGPTVYEEKDREELVDSGEMSPEEAGFMQGYEQAGEEKKGLIKEELKPEEKKGFFGKIKEKIVTTKVSYDKFENLFSELELTLMENNVALEVIEKIKYDLQKNIVEKPIKRNKIEETIKNSLKNSVGDLFNIKKIDLLKKIKENEKRPFVIAFFGINGSGKTTTIAKISDLLKNNNLTCVLAASDTFRAASIEQLQIHADKLGIKLIKHDYGSDPAAVSFDAIKHAQAKKIDVVLIDTAGRLHNQANLMQELKKIVTVSKPDLRLFVGESIAGNDCTEQAQKFNEVIGIDGIILTKADVDEKGGAAISVSYVTKKPIVYLGVGQEYSDLKVFDSNLIVEGLGL
jgi:fused signal recognition particle receptor